MAGCRHQSQRNVKHWQPIAKNKQETKVVFAFPQVALPPLLLGIFYQSNAELTEVVLDGLDLRCLQTQQFKDLSEQNNLQMKIN